MATHAVQAGVYRWRAPLPLRSNAHEPGAASQFITALAITLVLLTPTYLALAMPPTIGLVLVGVFMVLLAVLAGDEAARGYPIFALVAVATVLVGQNFFIGLALNLVPDPSETMVLVLIELKTVFVVALLGYIGVYGWGGGVERRRFMLVSAALIAVALLAALHGEGSLITQAAYLRNFATPALYVLLGWALLSRSKVTPGRAWSQLAAGIVAIAVPFSVLHAVAPSAWESVLQLERLEGIKGPISAAGGLPGLLTLPRAGGLIAEGVNASYLFAALALVLISCRRWGAAAVACLGAVLAFGKGGLLLLVAGVAAFALRRLLWGHGASMRRLVTFALIVVAGSVLALVYVFVPTQSSATGAFGTRSSAETHVIGLVNGVSAAVSQPLGQGLGAGGNFSDIAAGGTDPAVWIASGAESAVGVVAFQLGVAGVLLLLAQLITLQSTLYRRAVTDVSDRSLVMAAAILVAIITVLLAFQENALSPQAVGLSFLLAGSLAFRTDTSGHREGAKVGRSA